MLFSLIPLGPYAAHVEEKASACPLESQQHVGCRVGHTLRLPTRHFKKLEKKKKKWRSQGIAS